ncbi:hypothetical protein [Sinomonas terrae]|uniref:Uncharacterized protein n=1 Tax=Sinomonas terrae TaxID=2908838 RepID=A0ABS9U3L7_9MICC|nr:hypothetical protein [Sinomonas terrae]MCH6471274.1 hypothetical protein [Sinomonas terrae]
MGFFPPVPDAAPARPPQPQHPEWFAPPPLEMPAVVPLEAVLAQTDRVTLAVECARVYANGATFDVRCVRRRADESDREWAVQAHERMGIGHAALGDPTSLRFGILYPDGSKALTEARPALPITETPAPRAVLRQASGSGSGGEQERTIQLSLWLWPLPEPGLHRLVAEWQAAGIPESSLEFDGALLRSAAQRARPYWT